MELNIFYSTLKTSNVTTRLRIEGFTLIEYKFWIETNLQGCYILTFVKIGGSVWISQKFELFNSYEPLFSK